MPLSNDEIYRVHVDNLRAVEKGCNQVYLQLKRCLAVRQDAAASALLKVFVLLIGAWSEVRLLKLLYEAGGFSNIELAIHDDAIRFAVGSLANLPVRRGRAQRRRDQSLAGRPERCSLDTPSATFRAERPSRSALRGKADQNWTLWTPARGPNRTFWVFARSRLDRRCARGDHR